LPATGIDRWLAWLVAARDVPFILPP